MNTKQKLCSQYINALFYNCVLKIDQPLCQLMLCTLYRSLVTYISVFILNQLCLVLFIGVVLHYLHNWLFQLSFCNSSSINMEKYTPFLSSIYYTSNFNYCQEIIVCTYECKDTDNNVKFY